MGGGAWQMSYGCRSRVLGTGPGAEEKASQPAAFGSISRRRAQHAVSAQGASTALADPHVGPSARSEAERLSFTTSAAISAERTTNLRKEKLSRPASTRNLRRHPPSWSSMFDGSKRQQTVVNANYSANGPPFGEGFEHLHQKRRLRSLHRLRSLPSAIAQGRPANVSDIDCCIIALASLAADFPAA